MVIYAITIGIYSVQSSDAVCVQIRFNKFFFLFFFYKVDIINVTLYYRPISAHKFEI